MSNDVRKDFEQRTGIQGREHRITDLEELLRKMEGDPSISMLHRRLLQGIVLELAAMREEAKKCL